MGLEPGGTDRRAGETARLYVGGISKWEIDFIAPPQAPTAVQLNATPATAVVATGGSTTLAVTATGTAPLMYQWSKDGVVLPQATTASYTIAAAGATDAGVYSVIVTNALGATESNRLTLAVKPPPETFLSNLAVRALLPSEEATLTLGFTVRSAEPKPLLVRAIGPSLALFNVAGAVPDPRLALLDSNHVKITENDDWVSDLAETFAAVGAFALPVGSADAAATVALPAGSGSAQVAGNEGGIVLAEVYDLAASAASKVTNLSIRGWVGTDDQVMVGGFSLSGSGTKRFLIRVLGPQLEAFGVAHALADPVLEIFTTGAEPLATNDDWDAALAPTFATAGASPLPLGSRDAALVITLAAGDCCLVVIRSADGQVGEALLEIFEVL
jgi:hypothetical protein